MADPAGESTGGALRLDFDRRLMLKHPGIRGMSANISGWHKR